MKKVYFLLLLSFTVFQNCKSQKFQLEENPDLTLKEGFFKEIPAGVAFDESTIELSLTFNDFNKNSIKLNGLFFRDAALNSKYSKVFTVVANYQKGVNIEKEKLFTLANNEVVVEYKQDGKVKFVKYILKQKQMSLNNIPMQNNN